MTGGRSRAPLGVSVVIPALNEEDTVADVVRACLKSRADEVLVIDSQSTDRTAARAACAGARVVDWRGVDKQKPWPGKGEALWRGVKAAAGDVVVFVDADVTNVEPWWVDVLAEPFTNPQVQLAKATYVRDGAGGRVTELTAKPLLSALFPEIGVEQPLGGEYAIRRDAALTLPFVAGYGVDVGLLIDVAQRFGPGAIAQVDLGYRTHRNRPLEELKPMADVVARTILHRAGVGPDVAQRPAWAAG